MTALIPALAFAALAFILIALVLIGAHREAPWTIQEQPPTRLAAFARAVLGVYVRKNECHDSKTAQISPLSQGRR
jgi:peptidoglycan/LPS O-acetylase OafA/YrhL